MNLSKIARSLSRSSRVCFHFPFNSIDSFANSHKGANLYAAFNWGDRIYHTVMGDWERLQEYHGRMRVLMGLNRY